MKLHHAHEQTLNHISNILGFIHSDQYKDHDPVTISSQLKINSKHDNKNNENENKQHQHHRHNINLRAHNNSSNSSNIIIRNFEQEIQKYQQCGISFDIQTVALIQHYLKQLAHKQKTSQIRFWGVIRGTQKDYYVIQGRKQPYKSNQVIPGDAEKNGQGVNFNTFWVNNNLQNGKWIQLPDIIPQHIRAAKQIKKLFTGNLQQAIQAFPQFKGKQKHYLKAQLCRITHSLQLVPKGIYKVNDENPKIIEFEQQVKIPDFAQLNSLQGWNRKNQLILNLGRVSHYVDQTLPQQQVLARTTELAEKDPEGERLKGINQDKVPQQSGLGIQNPWILKQVGNNQVFTKDDANLIYGAIVLRNIFWPGWMTIGYKNGFSNIYVGNGLKSNQNSLNIYQNPDLQKDAEDIEQFRQPNPKDLPKQPAPEQQQPKPEDQ